MASVTRGTLREDDVDAHTALASTTYPGAPPSDPRHVRWKHRANPAGPSVVISLPGRDGHPVGHVFVQRRAWVTGDGREIRGGLVTDLMLAPSARGAGAFIALMTEARAPNGVDIILHTANEVSEPLYRRLLRYPVALDLVAYGCPTGRVVLPGPADGLRQRAIGTMASVAGITAGRMARLLAPVVARVAGVRRARTCPGQDERAAAHAAFRAAAGPHLRRDRAFLDWRFRDAPSPAVVHWVRMREGATGYVALATVTLGGLRAMGVQDVMLPRPPRGLEGLALRLMVMAAASRSGGGVVIGLWNPAAPLSRWMTGLPFIRVPERLLPHASPIFVAPVPGSAADADDLRGAYLALADLDYF